MLSKKSKIDHLIEKYQWVDTETLLAQCVFGWPYKGSSFFFPLQFKLVCFSINFILFIIIIIIIIIVIIIIIIIITVFCKRPSPL